MSPSLDPAEVRITASLLRYEQLELERTAEREPSAKSPKVRLDRRRAGVNCWGDCQLIIKVQPFENRCHACRL